MRLRVDRVLTTVQLERQNLLMAANALGLPRVTYTCRTRVTQNSNISLTFVALEERLLERCQRELMHDAGLAEAHHQCPKLILGI